MRLAIREPAAHGRAHPRRDLRIEHVHVQAHVDEPVAGNVLERFSQHGLDPEPVDIAHRVHARVELGEQVALPVVELAHTYERDAGRIDRGQLKSLTFELGAREPERDGQRHSVDVSGRRGLGTVEVAVRVEPEDPAGPLCAREPAERSERDGVVAAEHEGQSVALHRAHDQVGDPRTRLLDLREEAHPLVSDGAGLGDGRPDVAPVLTAPPESLYPRLQPRVPDRRGAHVDAAPAGSEIERGADHRDPLRVFRRSHRGKAICRS